MVWQFLGGLSGATSVAAGAYGAHGLSKRLQELEAEGKNPFAPPRLTTPERRGFFSFGGAAGQGGAAPTAAPTPTAHEVWSRAVAYQQLHSVGLLLTPLLTPPGSPARAVAGGMFATGIALFSGGLYGTVLTGDKKVSQGAPVGGIAFILGWLALAVAKRPMLVR